ncbi:hypothetical protein HJC23_002359 [Cyclotella cryptica]|uniref:Tubulin-folding cofactor E n=1 Tax=Cyclotella cryptica TaxID=29204 RepID=A0ABD3QN89_9STRA|eukprot:CCRYP_004457-RA/>CCRYP_004457-RA protein AED:0.00 eAED:0.00 QI:64/-1/1/1/-1/1/1/214/397
MSHEDVDDAKYVRRDECIRLSSKAGGGGWAGSIVRVGDDDEQTSFWCSSTFLIGEVEEILILDENMNTLAAHNKASHPRYSVEKSPQQRREELLKKRHDLQRRQNEQSHALRQKHEEERNQIENHPNFTDEEMDFVLVNVMEPMHRQQLRLMQERHQKELANLMDVMLASAFGVCNEDGGGVQFSREKTENQGWIREREYERKDPPEQLSVQSSVASSNVHTLSASTSVGTNSVGTSVDEYSTESSARSRSAPLSPVPESPNADADHPFFRALQQIQLNDPNLGILELDGQDEISKKDWKKLFQCLEKNNKLQHLSLQDCGLNDEMIVPLALSLVENESILSINLANNFDLSDDSGKILAKVLTSNKVLNDVDLSNTSISPTVQSEIEAILVMRIDV